MVYLLDLQRTKKAVLENATKVGYSKGSDSIWKATFTLDSADPKFKLIEHLNYVEIFDIDDEEVGLFRIIPSLTTSSEYGSETTFTCYHVLHTLSDSVIFGMHYGFDVTPANAMTDLLSYQKIQHWTLGTIDTTETIDIFWENENGLISPLFDILSNFDSDHFFTYDTSVYPWKINLRKITDEPVCRVREGYNMSGFEIESNPESMINRIYPIGMDEEQEYVYIGDPPYVEDAVSVAKYGPIEYIYENLDTDSVDILTEEANQLLKAMRDVKISWRCTAYDFLKLVDEPKLTIDRLRLNSRVRIETINFGDVDMYIQEESKDDIFGEAVSIDLTMGSTREPMHDASYIHRKLDSIDRRISANKKSILARGREIATDLINSGHGGFVRIYPDRILIMDTEDEATAVNVWQWNKNGMGYSITGIMGPYIYAWTIDGAFNTDFIGAGSITTNHLSPDIGETLNISSNSDILFVLTENQRLTNELNIANDKLSGLPDDFSQYIRFGPSGLELGKRNNPVLLNIVNDSISFWESGRMGSYFTNNTLNSENIKVNDEFHFHNFSYKRESNGSITWGRNT